MEESLDSVLSKNSSASADSLERTQEADWIAAAQRGDSLAFNRLVLRWEKPIYNLNLRMLQDPEDAAETTQEVFLSAYRSIRRFRNEARFSTWIYRIAVNHCISRIRRRPVGSLCSLDDTVTGDSLAGRLPKRESHERELLLEETRTQVRVALQHLPADQRAVVELKFFQGLTFEEIAAIVKSPLSTVKSRLYSGLEILKVRLGRTALEM